MRSHLSGSALSVSCRTRLCACAEASKSIQRAPQSHGTTVAFRGLPGKIPPMLRMVRCHECPHESLTHVTTCAAMFSIVVLVVTSCRAVVPHVGHAMRLCVVPGNTTRPCSTTRPAAGSDTN